MMAGGALLTISRVVYPQCLLGLLAYQASTLHNAPAMHSYVPSQQVPQFTEPEGIGGLGDYEQLTQTGIQYISDP
jgi:hypothetical protein